MVQNNPGPLQVLKEHLKHSRVQLLKGLLSAKSTFERFLQSQAEKLFTIQKPASFTWQAITLPAPVASTINPGLTVFAAINGATIPAVVSAATFAAPEHSRRIAAIIHATSRGDIFVWLNKDAT